MSNEQVRSYVENSDRLTQKESISPTEASAKLTGMLDAFQKRVDSLPNLSDAQKKALMAEIRAFFFDSVTNSLRANVAVKGGTENVLGKFNSASHDTDREPGLDRFEFDRYVRTMEDAASMITELGWVDKFRAELVRIHNEIESSATINMDLMGTRREKTPYAQAFTEKYAGSVANLPPEEVKRLLHVTYKDGPADFWKGLSIAVGTKMPAEMVELLGKFVYDTGKAVMQFPEYLYFGVRFKHASSTTERYEYSEKMKSRLDDNLALGVLALAYDGTADMTWNLFRDEGKISADAQSSRYMELIHSIGTPDTWTPEGIKDAIVALLPLLVKLRGGRIAERKTPPPEIRKTPATEPGIEIKPLPELDVKREPMKLRKVEDAEFSEMGPEKMRIAKKALTGVIGEVRYNTVDRSADLLKDFEKRGKTGDGKALLDTYAKTRVAEDPKLLENGGNCVDMTLELKKRLEKEGIRGYGVRFESGNLMSDAANQYSEISHLALIVPKEGTNGKSFVLLDPGLQISKPVEFELGKPSPKVDLWGGAKASVVPNPDAASPYPSLLQLEQANGKMKKIPFDPTKELLNPFDVITKDLMRGTWDLKIVKTTPEGVPLGFARVDIVKKTVSLQEWSSKDAKTDVAFEKFEEYLKTPEGKRKFTATAAVIGENPQTLLDKIRIIVRDSKVYENGLLLSDESKKH